MGKVRTHMTMSVDGYVAGPNQSLEKPFGDGTDHLNDWLFKLRAIHEMFGEEGGETGGSDDLVRERFANVGAVIMGRNMFGGGPGPWGDGSWKGWWGDDPPYHTPVFVLTHYARAPLEMQGGTTFHFVTDGIRPALDRARTAAGDLDVVIGGGANAVQQYLAAGLVDEVEIHLVPVIVGGGERLFDNLGAGMTLQQLRVVEGSGVTHLKYGVARE